MKFKKSLTIVTLVLILMAPTIAFANSHAYTFNFKKSLTSKMYYLEPIDSKVHIEHTSSTYGGTPTSKLYYVDLFSESGIGGGTLETTFTFPRSGTTDWITFVDSKSYKRYYMKFRKSEDGATVEGYGRLFDIFR